MRALARRRCRKLALLSAEFRHFARALERFVVDAHESATVTLVRAPRRERRGVG